MGKKHFQKNKKGGPNRKARLIVRNLPFKTTEEKIREHFEKYGQINEINLLKRSDGKLVGCGFIQFNAVQEAAKALYNTSGKPFMGRDIVTDWAVPKDRFVEQLNSDVKVEIKDENGETPAPIIGDIDTTIEIKDEVKVEEADQQIKSIEDGAKSDNEEDVKPESEDDVKSESDDDDIKSETDEDEVEIKSQISETETKPKVISNDVSEGRTVFVKNVPFMATNDDLKFCMQQFGRVFYALVCKDQYTEHSKGTAFVKFVVSLTFIFAHASYE